MIKVPQKAQINKMYIKTPRFFIIIFRIKKITNAATTVKMMNKVVFSINNADSTSTMIENPMINKMPGSPSLYKTRKKLKYTSARPVSFCIKMIPIGNKMMQEAIILERSFVKSVSVLDKYLDSASNVHSLVNSAG